MVDRRRDWDRLLAPLLRARRFDETLVNHGRLITGVFHVSIGMEATAAAHACVREEGDVAMLGHRNHAHLLALASDPADLYREMLGRDGGPQRGRAGSLHLADPSRGVPYTSAMLGGGAAIANGIALAMVRRGSSAVAFAFFGDGAMGEGALHETLGLSRAWRLPVLFVCESNAPASGAGTLAALAEAHGVAGSIVDGRDPRGTLNALADAAAAVRAGAGSRFIEAVCDPSAGNSTFIPRPEPMLDLRAVASDLSAQPFLSGDPVRNEARALLSDGIPLPHLLELDAAICAQIRAAFELAEAAPSAPGSAAHEDVWG